jgi:pimeloyl-ACP methyl ester carboxylesterase
MADSELRALGNLAVDYADKALTSTVQGVHSAVSTRVFDAAGAGSAAARATHDAISDTVYGALRVGGRGVGSAIAGASQLVGGERETRTVSSSRFGRATQAAINGLIGDRLETEENALRIDMALRLPNRDVTVRRTDLEAAFDEPSGRVVVFVHGLCETEEAWWLGTRADPAEGEPAPRTYGARLRDDLGYSPLYLRYNSGLHVSENGRRLSWLLEELCREWPTRVTAVALVGHSMGGLIARSACHEAATEGRAWVERTSHVVCLGAPNTGSWLEKVVNVGGWAMRNVPESRPFADFLELRSAGIKDLRFGYLQDADWQDHDPDERLRNRAAPLAPVPGIAYHFVSGGLTAAERHPVASAFGDLLVRRHSATGPLTLDGAPAGDARHVQGASHFHLLNHPRVYDHLREWLTEPEPARGAAVSFDA